MGALAATYDFFRVFAGAAHAIWQTYVAEWKHGTLTPADIGRIARNYCTRALQIIGCEVEVIGTPTQGAALFLGNHLSYLDIVVLMSLAPVAFVAKEEVGRIPIIGTCTRRSGCVLVKRESQQSRRAALEAIRTRLAEGTRSITIFPSGTTCLHEAKPWRRGAFQIAQELGCTVQPFRLRYDRARAAAYIDQDVLPVHLWRLIKGGKFKATIEFAPTRVIADAERECDQIWNWCREFLPAPSAAVCEGGGAHPVDHRAVQPAPVA